MVNKSENDVFWSNNKGRKVGNGWDDFYKSKTDEKKSKISESMTKRFRENMNDPSKVGKFFEFAKVDKDTTVIYLYGEITSSSSEEFNSVGSSDFQKQLDKVTTKNLEVHINSYGGEVAEGLAIYNLLKDFKGNVTTINDGFACSVASVIFMAGKQRIMPRTALILIHNAWTIGSGDSNAMKKMAEDLEKITSASVEVYVNVTGQSKKTIQDLMDVETWLQADEALEYGFITEIKGEIVEQSKNQKSVYEIVMKMKALEKNNPKLKIASTWKEFYK